MGPEAGQTICGHITIESELDPTVGATAFGPVLAATSTEVSTPLWLTVIGRKLTPKQVDLSRFMAGANALYELEHRSLIRTMVVDRESDFAIVGYAAPQRARPLREVIETDEGRSLLVKLAIEMARGLTFLHRLKRVHGALAPGSVLLLEGKVRLWQYGLAELLSPERFSERASAVGGDVVAPEVRKGKGVTPASDIYAWGALVAGLATGCAGAEAILAVQDGAADFSEEQRVLRVLVERALSQDANERPQNGMELLEALSQIGGEDARRAQKYFLEVYEDDEENSQAVAVPVTPENTPPDGVTAAVVREEERNRQRQREQQRADLEAKKAKWGKAPPPIPIDPQTSKPPPPPASAPPLGVYHPSGERKPERPTEAVDTMLPPGDSTSSLSGTRRKKSAQKPTPKAVGETSKPQTGQDAASVPLPDDSVSGLQLDMSRGAMSVRAVGARIKDDDEPATGTGPSRPVPRAVDPRERTIGDVTRRPGPHGPRGSLMAASVALLVTALALWTTVAAAGAAGGMAQMIGMDDPEPDAPEAGTSDQAPPQPEPESATDGTKVVAPAPQECPPEMALHTGASGSYCIDLGEQPGLREPPATNVRYKEAKKACEDLGRRLCTEAEWTAACGGPEGLKFPYGNEHQQDRCNEPGRDGAVVDLTRSGARDSCRTQAGVLDLVGNVSEWVDGGAVLGGDATTKLPTCKTRKKVPKRSASPARGFRCCLSLAVPEGDAEPAADEGGDEKPDHKKGGRPNKRPEKTAAG